MSPQGADSAPAHPARRAEGLPLYPWGQPLAFACLPPMPPIAVIDFETTGMSPSQGARATEVAIVLLEG